MRTYDTIRKSIIALLSVLLFLTDAGWLMAQQTSDGPIFTSFRVRRVYARNYDDTFSGITNAENTWRVWAQDAANLDGTGWRGGNCITYDIGAGSFPFTSPVINTVMFSQTYATNVPTSYQIRMDAWEDDCPTGNRCSFDNGGFSCAFDGDDRRCNVQNFAGNINFRNNAPGFWTNNGWFFACGNDYGLEVESFWRFTLGNTINDPIVIGSTNCNNLSYSHTNSNSGDAYGNNLGGGNNQVSPDVWYQFTICQPSDVTLSTCNATTNYDTYIHLVNSAGTILNSSDDNCTSFPISGLNRKSFISVNNLAPGTYYAVVEGFQGNQGVFQLDANITPRSAVTTISGLPGSVCIDGPSSTLTGSPTGGTFSGPGISGNTFNPSSAGAGTHTITYNVPAGNNYTVSSTGFGLTNHGGTSVSLGNNQLTGAQPIGFPFCFYGNTYTNFYISDNGFISFSNNGQGCCSGQALPNTANPDNLIALAWEDLNPTAAITSSSAPRIGYGVVGTAPNRVLIVTYHEVDHWPSGNKVTGQIKLFEGTNRIETHLETMPSDGGLHTQGIENSNGTIAITPPGRNRANWSATNSAFAYEPPLCSGSRSQQVTVNPLPNANFSGLPSSVCIDGNSSTLSASQGGGSFSGPGVSGSTFNPSAAGTGTHTITYSITDGNGCSNSSSQTVTVNPLPNVSFSGLASSYCPNAGNVSLSGSPSGGTFSGPGVSGNTFSPASAGTGTHTITYTYTNGNGCTNSTSQSTTVADNTNPNAICQDVTVTLNASGSGSLTASQVNNGSTDNCGIANISISPSTFDCSDVNSVPSLLPTGGFAGRTVTYNSVTINGQNTRVINVNPSSAISLTLNWTNTYTSTFCPGCIQQYYLGLSGDGVNETCLYSGGSNSTFTRNNTVNFVAPSTPGIYAVSFGSSLQFNCVTRNYGARNLACDASANGIVALIYVGNAATTTTLTVTDNSGNTSSCTANVLVEDVTPPTAQCQNVTVQLDASGNASVTAGAVNNGSSDACGIRSTTLDITSFDCSNTGSNPVTLTVEDNNCNTSTCTATVTVEDNIDPVANCPANISVNNDPGICGATVTYNVTATDNCPGVTTALTSGQASGTVFNVGTSTVSWTATDASQNTHTCSFTVTVTDSEAPNAICQNVTIQVDAAGNASIGTGDIDNGSNDNCGITSRSLSNTNFTCANLGPNTVTLTVTDAAGNQDQCTGSVTVEDLIAPTLNGVPADLTVSCYAVPSAANVTASDNCGTPTFDFFEAPTPGPVPQANLRGFWPFNEGSGTVTADISGNGNDGVFSPGASWTPGVYSDAVTFPGTGNDYVEIPNGTGGDLDAQFSLSMFAWYYPGTTGGRSNPIIQFNPNGWGCHLWQTGTNQLFVRFTQRNSLAFAPAQAANVLIPGQWNLVGATYDFATGVSTLYCNGVAVATQTIGQFQLSTNYPVRIGSVNFDGRRTNSRVDNALIYDRALSAPEVSAMFNNSCPQNYTVTRTWTATDGSGNSTTDFQVITVIDTTPPVVSCPANITQSNDPGQCSAVVNFTATATDNCSGNVSLSYSTASGSTFQVGTTPVTVTATDECGNASTCTFNVMVTDDEDPVITCPQNVTIECDESSAPSNTGSATATDNCNSSPTISFTDVVTAGPNPPAGAIHRWSAEGNGNDAIGGANGNLLNGAGYGPGQFGQGFTFDGVNDLINFNNTVGNFGTNDFTICFWVNTNSSGSTMALLNKRVACGAIPSFWDFRMGPTGLVGFELRTATLIGNVATTGSVNDGNWHLITVTRQGPISRMYRDGVLESTGNAGAVVNADNGAFMNAGTDICVGQDGTVNFNGSMDEIVFFNRALSATEVAAKFVAGCPSAQTITRTWTADDGAGNTTSCVQTIDIVDSTPPTAICQSVTVNLDAAGNGSITPGDINNGSSDNCGNVSLALDTTAVFCADVGANTVTLTVTDECGNASTCSATVTVEDNIAPAILCQDVTVYLDANGEATLNPGDIQQSATDACGIAGSTINGSSSVLLLCANVGQANTAQLEVTDVNGNSSTCISNIDVQDTIPAVASCQDITIQLDANGEADVFPADVDAGSGDACGIASLDVNGFPSVRFLCANIGQVNTVQLNVIDVNGNTSSCISNVTVIDSVPAVAVCQDITVQLNANGEADVFPADVDGGSSDACGIDSLNVNGFPSVQFLCANVGQANTVQLNLVDANGNTSSCISNVTVEDNVAPVAVCQDITIQLDSAGQASILPGDVDGGSSDACGIASLELNDSSFICADTNANSVLLTVNDVNGNSSTCTAQVTVEDNIAPVALCMDATVSLDNLGQATLLPIAVDAGTYDNCGLASLIVIPGIYTCVNVGTVTATLRAVDISGNLSTCTAQITVNDQIPPVALCQDVTVQLDASGNGSVLPIAVDAGSNDACGIASYALDTTDFTCSDVGSNPVVLTVTDQNGNSSSCNANVIVEDNVNPIALCQDLTIQLDASGNASITPQDVDNGSNDACGIQSLSLDNASFSCADVSTGGGGGGPTPTELFISEYVEGSSTGDQVLEFFNGTGAPIDLSGGGYAIDIHLNGSPTASVSISLTGTVANNDVHVLADNNSSALVQNVADQIANFNFTGDDAIVLRRGSITLDIFGVVGNDPGNRWVLGGNGTRNSTLIRLPNVTAGVTVNPTGTGAGAFTTLATEWSAIGLNNFTNLGTHNFAGNTGGGGGGNTVTLTVTDLNGNQSICTASITVEDTVPPVALCQDLTVQLDANGEADVFPGDVDGGSNDACGIDSLDVNGFPSVRFLCANVGQPNTVQLNVLDVNGNASSCISNITVEDNVPPVALCNDLTVYLDANGQFDIFPADVDAGSNDACGIASLDLNGFPSVRFLCANVGQANTVTLNVVDVNGNASSCTSNVDVLDTIPPVAVCQDITVQLDANGEADVFPADVDGGSTDACGIASSDVNGFPSVRFFCANVGQANTVQLNLVDVNGNTASCIANVAVEDNVPPVALCNDLTVFLDANGEFDIFPADVDAGSNDACGIDSLDLNGFPSVRFLCANVGQANTVTLNVIDVNGNASSCVSNVEVRDTVPPVALCQDVTVFLDANGQHDLFPADVDAGSNDACGIASLDVNGFPSVRFFCANVGQANTVTLNVIDVNGNAASCVSNVEVRDTVPPIALCQDLTINLPSSGSLSITAQDIDNGSNDACGVDTVFLDRYTFDCTDQGPNAVTLSVIDVNGNLATCSATVTVTVDPIAIVLSSPTYNCGFNISCFGSNDGEASASVTGGCLPYTYQWDDPAMQTTATASNLSAGTYTVTVTDINGNVASQSITLTQPDSLILDLGPDINLNYGCSCTDLAPASITGGCPPYTYLWGSLETTEVINVCPDKTTFYPLTITDANGCEAKDSVYVIKPSSQGQTDQYVVLGGSRVQVGAGSVAILGAVGVNDGTSGLLQIGAGANLNAGGGNWVLGHSISVSGGATVGDLYTNSAPTIGGGATVGSIQPFPSPLPVTPCVPPVPGGTNIVVPTNGSINLTPGDYGTLNIGTRGVLNLAPGIYTFTQINTASDADVISTSNLGSDVAIFVDGTVGFGDGADIIANIATPTSRIQLGNNATVYGSLIADQVAVGTNCVLKLEAYCWQNANCGLNKDEAVAEIESSLGDALEVLAYPNPFRTSTAIQFRLLETQEVKVEILSVNGVLITTLFEGEVEAGMQQEVTFAPEDKTAGIYFYRLTTSSGLVRNGKLIFQR